MEYRPQLGLTLSAALTTNIECVDQLSPAACWDKKSSALCKSMVVPSSLEVFPKLLLAAAKSIFRIAWATDGLFSDS